MKSLVVASSRWHSRQVATAWAECGECHLLSGSVLANGGGKYDRLLPAARLGPPDVQVHPAVATLFARSLTRKCHPPRRFAIDGRSILRDIRRTASKLKPEALHLLNLLPPDGYGGISSLVIADRGAPTLASRTAAYEKLFGWRAARALPEYGAESWFSAEADRADMLLVPTPRMAQDFAYAGYGKTVVVPYGVPEPSDNWRYSTTEGVPTLGYLGPYSVAKGYDTYLRAVELLGERVSAISAGFPVSGEQSLTSLRVMDIGQIHYGEVEEFYSKIDILVQPSYLEGSSLVIYEAAIRGIPVICTPEAGAPEVLQDKVLHFPPGDPRALADMVSQYTEIQSRIVASARLLSVKAELSEGAYIARLGAVFATL